MSHSAGQMQRFEAAWPRGRRVLVAVSATMLAVSLGGPARAEPTVAPARAEVCRHIEQAAGDHGLPVAYLTRLIWRESSFRAGVVSAKGARGIAQFMPATAAERGLDDPFDPDEAIEAAASLLSDLKHRFGNLGLAAAAYNAGSGRVAGWITAGSGLPHETHRFVRTITGRPASDWLAEPRDPPESARPIRCLDVVAAMVRPQRRLIAAPSAGPAPSAPWGVQVAGNFSRERALSSYAAVKVRHDALIADGEPMVIGTRSPGRGPAVFFQVLVPAQSRAEAQDICARLRADGGSCAVHKS